MTRRSERGKNKSTSQEDTPEKTPRKPSRQTRRRRKSSSSSEGPSQNLSKEVDSNVSQTLGVELEDIQLPQENEPPSTAIASEKGAASAAITTNSEETGKDWKEDNSFWENDDSKPEKESSAVENEKEKEENSLWNVQSSNGAGGGGEIPKLKICRQRPTESPELGDTAVRKRSNPGPRDGRTTDDSAHEESEKDPRKLKHRTRTSSRNSPMLSPTVVCDMSEGSPTKIKIINVSLISKGGPKTGEEDCNVNNIPNPDPIEDIALPVDNLPQKPPQEEGEEVLEVKLNDSQMDIIGLDVPSTNVDESPKDEIKHVELPEDSVSTKISPKKSSSGSSSPTKLEEKSPSKSSRSDTDSTGDESKPRRVKKKRRRELQSTIQRKKESSDSEDVEKKEAVRRDSSGSTEVQIVPNGQENKEVTEEHHEDNVDVKIQNKEPTGVPMARKRRWGSSKSKRSSKKQPVLTISTDVLKSIIPDAKPVTAEELQLSVEEEEGQLDDDEDEDDVVALVVKEEEKQLELERQKEEKQREKEKERNDKKKRQERFHKTQPEQAPPEPKEKGAAQRKILLLTDDTKKLAQSPSPSRRKPTSVLFISHLVRPFTVQQLKNLLLRTGTIAENGFWIDKIKSKCYVEYTTEDAAVETRHALHGVRWPTSNPKTLFVEFSSHEDLAMAQTLSEEPDVPRKAEPLNMVEGWVADQARIREKTRRPIVREWDVGKPEHPDEALEFEMKAKEKKDQERKSRKERHHRSRTPEAEPPARKARRIPEGAPVKLLDDLFRKTKCSPCIYWLPLSQEQIAVKEEMRRQHMAEHQRRMAELKKAEQARRDRERRNRK